MEYKRDYTSWGDLARDMIQDTKFPRKVQYKQDEYVILKKYLERVGASQNAINTFVDAYHWYLNESLQR